MKRLGTSLLFAYAAAVTVVAAWFGCRILVYHRLVAGMMGLRTQAGADEVSFEQIMTNFAVTSSVVGSTEVGVVIIASISIPQVATIASFVFLSCLVFPALRRPRPTQPALASQKD